MATISSTNIILAAVSTENTLYLYQSLNSGNWTSLQSNISNVNAVTLTSDGNYMAAGNASSNSINVYQWNSGTSEYDSFASIDNSATGGNFGFSVGITWDGTNTSSIHVVGGGNTYNSNSGYIQVYQYDGTSSFGDVSGIVTSTISDGQFGFSVGIARDSINGNIGVIGGMLQNSGASGAADTDKIRLFQYNGTAWSTLASIDAPSNTYRFGYSVFIRHQTDSYVMAIGSPYDSTGDATASGRVYVYDYTDSVLNEDYTIQQNNVANLQLGTSVAISDNIELVIGGGLGDSSTTPS